ncbi:helix-turn-helix domain-containing protein [Facklamia hominis]|uniref:helix-turn-helix domain-containing protein n=1 Tax=Facklamia hominis TaxID=178214 RepID=UPI0038FCE216
MYLQTTLNQSNAYFSFQAKAVHQLKPYHRLMTIQRSQSEALLSFDRPVSLSDHKGLALLVIAPELSAYDDYLYFLLQGSIQIKPHVLFNTLALTDHCQVYLEPTQNEEPQIITSPRRIKAQLPSRALQLKQIYASYYQAYASGEVIPRGQQDFYELVIVDQGQVQIHPVGAQPVTLQSSMAWLTPPGNRPKFSFKQDGLTTVVSILFEAEGIPDSLCLRPFKLGYRQLQLIERFIQLSRQSLTKPYGYDEVMAILDILLIQCINGAQQAGRALPQTSMRDNYEDETFQAIIDFLESHILEVHEVQELVNQFDLSRSSLQALFNKYTGKSPKSYINQLRLKKAKQYIHESQLTLSQIAEKLGYGSIQYFSRAFRREFNQSPSQYAKSIIK